MNSNLVDAHYSQDTLLGAVDMAAAHMLKRSYKNIMKFCKLKLAYTKESCSGKTCRIEENPKIISL